MKKLLIAIIIVCFFNFSCTEQEKIIPKEKTITWVIETDVDDILINSKDIHSILSNITFYWYPYDYKTVEFHGDTTITFTGKLAENMLNSHVWIEVFAYAYVNGGGINLLYPNQHFMPALEKDTIVIKNPTWFAP